MRILFITLFLCVFFAAPLFALQESVACDPETVGDWMVQRQLGRNRVQEAIDGQVTSLLDTALLVQEVRRTLEDLPRPDCADDLYIWTIYFYDLLVDYYTFQFNNQLALGDEIITPRMELFQRQVEPLYDQLQAVAGYDIFAAAAEIEPLATPSPTLPPPTPIYLRGEHGGVVEGPIDIPAGIYRVKLTGESANASLEVVDGDCFTFYMYTTAETRSSEEAYTSNGCRALIQIGMGDTPWELTFTPVQ